MMRTQPPMQYFLKVYALEDHLQILRLASHRETLLGYHRIGATPSPKTSWPTRRDE